MADFTQRVRLSRQELFELVWSVPTTKLAERFGISDVAIAKICRKLKVPKPHLGHWRKVEVGRAVRQPCLPKLPHGVPNEVTIQARCREMSKVKENSDVMAAIEAEHNPSNRILVSDTLRKAHPLVLQTRQMLTDSRPNRYGVLSTRHHQNCLDMRVSRRLCPRALRIMDAFLKAAESRGYSIQVSQRHWKFTNIVIGLEAVKIVLYERVQQKKLSGETRDGSIWPQGRHRWELVPSGRLTFQIDESYPGGIRKSWTDKPNLRLESQLNEVMSAVIAIAEVLRLRSLQRNEEDRRRKEVERQRLEAEERRKEEQRSRTDLIMQAEAWFKSQRIREFLRACESQMLQQPTMMALGSQGALWLKWGRNHSDALDPLKNGWLENPLTSFTQRITDARDQTANDLVQEDVNGWNSQ